MLLLNLPYSISAEPILLYFETTVTAIYSNCNLPYTALH